MMTPLTTGMPSGMGLFAAVHERYGPIDVLVNNAGRGMVGTAERFAVRVKEPAAVDDPTPVFRYQSSEAATAFVSASLADPTGERVLGLTRGWIAEGAAPPEPWGA